jgi:diguanylate cyclase (GGDEF)-like protein/PAS domain S-box-containing protein
MKQGLRYWASFALIILILFAVSGLLLWNQHQHDLELQNKLVQSRFTVIQSYTQHALDTGDYSSIQPLIDRWVELEPQIRFLEVRSANGFVHAHYQSSQGALNVISKQAILTYGYANKVFLNYVQSIDDSYHRLALTVGLVGFAMLVVVLFGSLLISHTRQRVLMNQEIERRNAEVNAQHNLLQSVIDSLPELIYYKSTDGEYRGSNRQFNRFHGINRESVCGLTDNELFEPQTADFTRKRDLAIIRSGHPIQGESWMTSAKGEEILMDTLHTPYFDEQNQLLGLIGICRDITRLRKAQKNLETLAYHDALTGLPNRVYLTDRMQSDMAHAKRRQSKLAICTIDLDGFKPVNDTHGHEIGDHVLRVLARRIKATLRTQDTVARWGGDEFTLLLNDIDNEDADIHSLLQRIQTAINAPVELPNGKMAYLTSSIGITIYPDDDEDADTLLRHADQAMYQSKQQGKNCYSFFDREHDQRIHSTAKSLADLANAISNDELELFYQPLLDLASGTVRGLEALLRWNHPEAGRLSPALFIPPAESHRANLDLDSWVLRNAATQLEKWRGLEQEQLLSINLSCASLQDPEFPQRVALLLEQSPACVGYLQFEILESTFFNDLEQVSTVISQCIDQGVSFALDDFGTGYSSLSYLRHLNADTIKIDRSFVANMLTDSNDLIIVDGIIRLGQAFAKHVVAEGVESIEHGQRLKAMGAQILQGYAIARPMPAAEVIPWLESYTCPPEWTDSGVQ